jgi:hypothetical protein
MKKLYVVAEVSPYLNPIETLVQVFTSKKKAKMYEKFRSHLYRGPLKTYKVVYEEVK